MITKDDIRKVRQKAGTLRALVIGDAMVDRYIYGTVDRISPEAPVPVLNHQRTVLKAGGSANVALNLASWGCQTSLIGLIGRDASSGILIDLLNENQIRHDLFVSEKRPTTVKTRIVAASHHLLRIDEESVDELTGDEEQAALDHILSYIRRESPDLIILEDYNKGFLTPGIITKIIRFAKESGIFVAADPKERHFFQYHNIDVFKPNLREASQAAGRNVEINDLSELSAIWQNDMNINTIAITLGSQGVFIRDRNSGKLIVPDRKIDVVDVCGAGDAVICALALGVMSGLSLSTIGALANLTGAYVCSHSGVVAVEPATVEGWATE